MIDAASGIKDARGGASRGGSLKAAKIEKGASIGAYRNVIIDLTRPPEQNKCLRNLSTKGSFLIGHDDNNVRAFEHFG